MTEEFRVKLAAPSKSKDDLLILLFEALGVEFINYGEAWKAELFGGTSFSLTTDPLMTGSYQLTILTDRSDPLFSKQQRSFGPIEELPMLLSRAFVKGGVTFQWELGARKPQETDPADPD